MVLDWPNIDTVLLDMDGTLLDLHFDNTLWNHVLPERYAREHAVDDVAARDFLFAEMRATRGSMNFYCLDYWARFTRMDLLSLHEELVALIQFRPGALELLDWLRQQRKHAVLVTNAHPDSLRIKDRACRIVSLVDTAVSTHDLGLPKEEPECWRKLRTHVTFDPARTLLVDDSQPVLQSAAAFGISHLRTVAQPDSNRPERSGLDFPALTDFRNHLPANAL